MADHMTRRAMLGGAFAAAVSFTMAASAPKIAEDGLYTQPWFVESFLDLREDFNNAKEAGKTLVLFWELKGCPACKLLHTVNFAKPEIVAYAKENFDIVQLNFIGSRPVTGLDGVTSPEKQLASTYRVEGTPTLQFFAASKNGIANEIARARYLKPDDFLEMLRFVRAKAYGTMPFEAWLRVNPPKP